MTLGCGCGEGIRSLFESWERVLSLCVKDVDNGLLSAITKAVVPLRSVWFAMRQYSGLCFLLKSNYPHKTEPWMCAEALHKSSRNFSGGNLASPGTRSHFQCLKGFSYGIGCVKFLPSDKIQNAPIPPNPSLQWLQQKWVASFSRDGRCCGISVCTKCDNKTPRSMIPSAFWQLNKRF